MDVAQRKLMTLSAGKIKLASKFICRAVRGWFSREKATNT